MSDTLSSSLTRRDFLSTSAKLGAFIAAAPYIARGADATGADQVNVAVIGCGGVGLAAINGAAIAGASRIIAVDLSPEKLQLATRFGATDGVLFADLDVLAIGPVVASVSEDFDRYWNSLAVYPLASIAGSALDPETLRSRFETATGAATTPEPAPLPPNDVLGYAPIADDLDAAVRTLRLLCREDEEDAAIYQRTEEG